MAEDDAVVAVGALPSSAGPSRQAHTTYARRNNRGSALGTSVATGSSPSSRVADNRGVGANAAVGNNGVGSDLLAAAVAVAVADGEVQAAVESADDEDYEPGAEQRDSSSASNNSVNPPLSTPRTKRKGPVVVRLDVLVAAPALEQQVFNTWEHFHEYLQDYGQKTFQLYSVRSATPSSRRNNLVTKKKGTPKTQQLIPEQFVHYVKTITCTHGGKPRPRSTGIRPNHHHRAIECPAQINACVKRDPQGTWHVAVTNQHAWHNHEISEAIYNGYPEVRNALGADVLATVNILRKAEAKRKKILEYIVENTPKKPRMKDVHNLLSKMKKKDPVSL